MTTLFILQPHLHRLGPADAAAVSINLCVGAIAREHLTGLVRAVHGRDGK